MLLEHPPDSSTEVHRFLTRGDGLHAGRPHTALGGQTVEVRDKRVGAQDRRGAILHRMLNLQAISLLKDVT
jgi:hypothetical protein